MNDIIIQLWQGVAKYLRKSGALVLFLVSIVPITVSGQDSWAPPALSGEAGVLPEGREVVQRAIDFMKAHEQVGFEAVVSYEVVQQNGQKLRFGMLQRVALARPQRLHWVTLHDDASTETAWVQDSTFTMLRQPANVWGQVRVPPTIGDAVSRISLEYNVPVPFADLLSGDAAELWLGDDVEWVNYIGEAWSDGQWTDHVAFRKPGADIQLWFRKGDEPFPQRMVIVHTEEEGLPAFSARFRKWSTQIQDGAIPKIEPPAESVQIEIVPVVRP